MTPVEVPAAAGAVRGKGSVFLVSAQAEPAQFLLPYRLPKATIRAAEKSFKTRGRTWPPGTLIITADPGDEENVAEILRKTGVQAERVKKMPKVAAHPVKAPRIALVHSWISTQDEGWYRYALDSLHVPYQYISVQDIAGIEDLNAEFDVLLFAPGIGSPADLVHGIPADRPIPWMTTDVTPNLGRIDSTPDMRPGMGLEGVLKIQRFLEQGGTLVAVGSSVRFPVDFGLVRWVSVREPRNARVSGSLLRASVVEPRSPLTYGYDPALTVYYDGGVLLNVGFSFRFGMYGRGPGRSQKHSGRGGPKDPDVVIGRAPEKPQKPPRWKPWEKGFKFPDPIFNLYLGHMIPPLEKRPRIVLAFAEKASDLLVSGLLDHGEEIAGHPAVVDVPVGRGHVLLFAVNPVWRNQSWGTYALLFHAFIHHGYLQTGWPPPEARAEKKPKSRS